MVTTQGSPTDPVYTVASGITWEPMSNLLAGMIHGNPFQPPSAVSPSRLADALAGRS